MYSCVYVEFQDSVSLPWLGSFHFSLTVLLRSRLCMVVTQAGWFPQYNAYAYATHCVHTLMVRTGLSPSLAKISILFVPLQWGFARRFDPSLD